MSRLPRFAIIFVLSFGCAGLPSAARSQTKSPKKAPAATISGRITIRGKGAAGIVVGIRGADYSSQSRLPLKATTDQDGFYRITGVPAGNYQVLPLAPVYILLDQPLFRGRGKSLLLAEGENVEGVDFSIERGGVITGKVTDADGRPVVEERLTIVPVDQANQPGQRLPPVTAVSFQTDDRGVYRIYGVPEGRYKITVGQAEDNYTPSNIGRVPYKRTFYPDASDANDAKVIEIKEGSEATDIDIRVGRSLPGFAASGKVVDGETGQPVVGLRFGLRRVVTDGYANITASVPSNSQGEFRMENVTAGKYTVLILPTAQGSEVRADPVTFEVVDQDVTGIVVKTSKGLSISGTVVIDGKNDPSVVAKLTQFRLRAYVRNDSLPDGFGQSSTVAADGSFRIGALSSGTANFSLNSQDNLPLENFAIARVERDGVVQPRGIEIRPGEHVTGVKVVLRYGTGSIRGEVKIENGPLPAGARLAVWIRKVDENQSNFRPYNVDSRGHFLIDGIPAGNYEVNLNAQIPGRRTAPPAAKQSVVVSDGAISEIVVSLDLVSSAEAPGP